jgi:hypothetical protein
MIRMTLAVLLASVTTVSVSGTALSRNQGSPSGSLLIREAQAAMKHAGSYHAHSNLALSESGVLNETLALDADISTHPSRIREVVTDRSTRFSGSKSSVNTRVDLLLVGKRAATRTNGAAWKCTSGSALKSLTGQFVNLSSFTTSSATNLGAGFVGGEPVWRVRAVTGVSTAAGQLRGPTIYEIGQRDHRIYGTDFRVHAALEGMTLDEHVSGVYSRFGESIQVVLPRACA